MRLTAVAMIHLGAIKLPIQMVFYKILTNLELRLF